MPYRIDRKNRTVIEVQEQPHKPFLFKTKREAWDNLRIDALTVLNLKLEKHEKLLEQAYTAQNELIISSKAIIELDQKMHEDLDKDKQTETR